MDHVILVDEQDREIGVMEKLQAHREGRLHRAFSVFLFNHKGEMLLQQRSVHKYHSEGLWSNACCSHPKPGENVINAAVRRVREEIGIDVELHYLYQFTYRAYFDNGLTEHEVDHVFVGETDETPVPDPAEVMDWKYMAIDDVDLDLERDPDSYTYWFRESFREVIFKLNRLAQRGMV